MIPILARTRGRLVPFSAARVAPREDSGVRLADLAAIFLLVGAMPVGGKTIPLFFQELVRKRQWITREDFLESQALAKLLPGASGTAMAIFITQRLCSPLGSLLGLGLYLLPGGLAMLAMSVLLFGLERPTWLSGALAGLAAAAVGLLAGMTCQLVPAARSGRFWPVFALLAFVAHGILRIDLLVVILGLGIPSIVLNRPRRRRAPWMTTFSSRSSSRSSVSSRSAVLERSSRRCSRSSSAAGG